MIDPLDLGATLYVPATRPDLADIVLGRKVPGLRSVVLCLEDAVRIEDVPRALAHVAATLPRIKAWKGAMRPLVFVRPRDPPMLDRLLNLHGIDRIDGFVIPKATADSLPAYLALPLLPHHCLMPTLESREMFDPGAVAQLRDQLLAIRSRVLVLRIGGNDLLHAMGLRRSPRRTSYEGPLGPIVSALVAAFAPYGFALSAPVMERFDDPLLLREEVARDLEYGLCSKTAIHPAQVPVIHAALAVAAADLAEAEALTAADAPAVFARAGRLCEPATNRRWASAIIRRAERFGVADPLPLWRLG